MEFSASASTAIISFWLIGPPLICISSTTWHQKPNASCPILMGFKDHHSPNYDTPGVPETNWLESKCIADSPQINPSILALPSTFRFTHAYLATITHTIWKEMAPPNQFKTVQRKTSDTVGWKPATEDIDLFQDLKATTLSLGVATTSWSTVLQYNSRVYSVDGNLT